MAPDDHRKARAAAVALLAIVLAGCNRSEPAPAARPATSAAPATTATTIPATTGPPATGVPATAPSEEERVLEAFWGFLETWDLANNPPDPDHPGLARYYTGPAYERAVNALGEHRARGIVMTRPPNSVSSHHPIDVRVQGDRASLTDCSVDDGVQRIAATGEVVNDRVATDLFEMTLVRNGSDWRVHENARLRQWDGVTACEG